MYRPEALPVATANVQWYHGREYCPVAPCDYCSARIGRYSPVYSSFLCFPCLRSYLKTLARLKGIAPLP